MGSYAPAGGIMTEVIRACGLLYENKSKKYMQVKSLLFISVMALMSVFPRLAEPTPEGIELMANAVLTADNTLVIDINSLTYTVAEQHDHFYSLIGIRALSMVHLAVHDALNAVDPKYETYAYNLKVPDADPRAAAIEAARKILLEIYPKRTDTINSVCQKWLAGIEESPAKKTGLHLGKEISETYIRVRGGDGHQKQGDYTPMSKPGDYQYTPGWDNWVLKPDFSYARPFALDTVTQFRSPPPPELTSESYTRSYDEVLKFGAKNSASRSADQTNFAHWWAEFGEHGWNRIVRITAHDRKLPLLETARLFALVNMDIYDIYLASLESKYHYDTWRPYTAIREAGSDGNPDTRPDMQWEPEMLTPPWPEYPSAHASVGAGGAEILSSVYGTPEVSFTMQSVTALPDAKTRTYRNLDNAAEDCGNSRIMNGYHFRFAVEEGLGQGRKIAAYILKHYLQPLD